MADREMEAAFEAALLADVVYPFLVGKIGTASGPFNCWTGLGDLELGGEIYHGGGSAAQASPVEETSDLFAAGMTFALNDIGDEWIQTALNEMRQGEEAVLSLGLWAPEGGVAGVLPLFKGLTDVPMLEPGPERFSASVSAESRFILLRQASERRHTHEDQQIDYPGDLGFEFVEGVQDDEIKWGKN